MRAINTANPSIPVNTAQAAREVYDLQNVYLCIGDQLPNLINRTDLCSLDPSARLSGDSVIRMALISAFQYAEELSDQAAAECTRKRMDWKYALYLSSSYPGINISALCEFRQNLYGHPRGVAQFAVLIDWLNNLGLFKQRANLTLDVKEILLEACIRSRLDTLNQAMNNAISMLVFSDQDWLRNRMPPHWYECYENAENIYSARSGSNGLTDGLNRLGTDIAHILSILEEKGQPDLLGENEIQKLAGLFETHYLRSADGISCRSGCKNCPSRRN